MKAQRIDMRNFYYCPSCKRQMYVDKTKLKGTIVERLNGRVYNAYCKCDSCKLHVAIELTSLQFEEEFRDP